MVRIFKYISFNQCGEMFKIIVNVLNSEILLVQDSEFFHFTYAGVCFTFCAILSFEFLRHAMFFQLCHAIFGGVKFLRHACWGLYLNNIIQHTLV